MSRSLVPSGGHPDESISQSNSLPLFDGEDIIATKEIIDAVGHRLPIAVQLLRDLFQTTKEDNRRLEARVDESEGAFRAQLLEYDVLCNATFDSLNGRINTAAEIAELNEHVYTVIDRLSVAAKERLRGIEPGQLLIVERCLAAFEDALLSSETTRIQGQALQLKLQALERQRERMRDQLNQLRLVQEAANEQLANMEGQRNQLKQLVANAENMLSDFATTSKPLKVGDHPVLTALFTPDGNITSHPLAWQATLPPEKGFDKMFPLDIVTLKPSNDDSTNIERAAYASLHSQSPSPSSSSSPPQIAPCQSSQMTSLNRSRVNSVDFVKTVGTSLTEMVLDLTDWSMLTAVRSKQLKRFFSTYPLYLTPTQLACMFALRFHATLRPEARVSNHAHARAHNYQQEQEMRESVQESVLAVVDSWLKYRPLDFSSSSDVKESPAAILLNMIDGPVPERLSVPCANLRHRLQADPRRWSQLHPTIVMHIDGNFRSLSPEPNDQQATIVVDTLTIQGDQFMSVVLPKEAARQLSLAYFDLYTTIHVDEMLGYLIDKDRNAPNVCAIIERFNGLSGLVATTVLTATSMEKRIEYIEYWIGVATECQALNNFHAMLAIQSALFNTSIFRLNQTWEFVDPRLKSALETIAELLKDNAAKLRGLTKKAARSPCVPYIGTYLSDLTFISDGNQTYVNGLVNHAKFLQIAERLEDFFSFISYPYHFERNPPIINWLMDFSRNIATDSWHILSLQLEGRTCTPPIDLVSVNEHNRPEAPGKAKRRPLLRQYSRQKSLKKVFVFF